MPWTQRRRRMPLRYPGCVGRGTQGASRASAVSRSSFHFDNEGPVHDVLIHPFEIGQRLVTNGEYLAFIEDGGYQRPELWLSAGWDTVEKSSLGSP